MAYGHGFAGGIAERWLRCGRRTIASVNPRQLEAQDGQRNIRPCHS
jgi:hypothetical protein